MYVHDALYKVNSVKTYQHLNKFTNQIMQDYCRGKRKDSNIRNLNMKAPNSDKFGHFEIVRIVLYMNAQEECLSLSLSPAPL